jgi:hypothetical protein
VNGTPILAEAAASSVCATGSPHSTCSAPPRDADGHRVGALGPRCIQLDDRPVGVHALDRAFAQGGVGQREAGRDPHLVPQRGSSSTSISSSAVSSAPPYTAWRAIAA